MDLWTVLGLYGVIALSIAWTGYFRLYRPSIELLEEILEQKTVYSGATGFMIWTTFATILAPGLAMLLLANDNDKFIRGFAVNLAERYDE